MKGSEEFQNHGFLLIQKGYQSIEEIELKRIEPLPDSKEGVEQRNGAIEESNWKVEKAVK